ncbi:hypothetical protein DFH09DRAFT_1289791, partial [Mycena vulgaris]
MHPSPANHPCPVCGRATSQWCACCQNAWYCSPEHLRSPPEYLGHRNNYSSPMKIWTREMCDSLYTPLQSGVLLWVLSLIPLNIFRYIGLGVAAVSGVIYIVYYRHPSMRMGRLDNILSATTDILARAKSHCLRDHLDLADDERRLL